MPILLFKVESPISLLIQIGALGPPTPWRPPPPPPTQTWEPIDRLRPELEAGAPETLLHIPLTKRQLKHRRNRDSKLAKKFVSLNAEINNLKSQMESLRDRVAKSSRSAHSGFKRKKIKRRLIR